MLLPSSSSSPYPSRSPPRAPPHPPHHPSTQDEPPINSSSINNPGPSLRSHTVSGRHPTTTTTSSEAVLVSGVEAHVNPRSATVSTTTDVHGSTTPPVTVSPASRLNNCTQLQPHPAAASAMGAVHFTSATFSEFGPTNNRCAGSSSCSHSGCTTNSSSSSTSSSGSSLQEVRTPVGAAAVSAADVTMGAVVDSARHSSSSRL